MSKHALLEQNDWQKAEVMYQRYSRALRLTAPYIATKEPGYTIDGYWLDNQRYFFLKEQYDATLGCVVGIPSVADCAAKHVDEVFPLCMLADMLSDASAAEITAGDLSDAEFDIPDTGELSVTVQGRSYLVDIQERRVLDASSSLGVPALYSPDRRFACFIRGYDIWLKDREANTERAITTDGARHNAYGQQSETCLAAVTYRQRPQPVGLWSPDSQWLLTHRIDERSVPDMPLVQHSPSDFGRPVLHQFKYAMPGDVLPRGTYVAIHVATGRTVTFDEFPFDVAVFSPFFYRRAWFGGGGSAWIVRMDRFCKTAELICLDLSQGTGRVVLSESAQSGYIDLHPVLNGTPNVRSLSASNEIIWFSEQDGWGHLYLHDALTGKRKNRITQGEWAVRDLVHVDEQARKIYFLATGLDRNADPGRRSLCAVNFDGEGFQIILTHDGDVFVPSTQPAGLEQERLFRPSYARSGLSPNGRFALCRFSSVDRGNETKIVDLDTREGFVIASTQSVADDVSSRQFSAVAADGTTMLHGVMFLPSDFDERRRYPLVVHIYPGPQTAHRPQAYRNMGSSLARTIAELGLVTIILDTRGVPVRNRRFHHAGYGELLEPQLADHAAVVRQLWARHAFIDRDRCGIIGSSGGGAATVRALCDYGEIFKVGVAACGNHDSTLYAAIWSDKYRSTEGRENWRDQANHTVVSKLTGKLLLIHGDMDENVHVSHTISLVDALIRANKDFDLLVAPNEGHSVLWTSGYAQRRAWDYLVEHLMGTTPPRNFEIKVEPKAKAWVYKRWTREVLQ